MTTKYVLKRRKAVSTVVAAVLLIAITVVAVAVVWAMVLPMLTPKAKITIANVFFDDTDGDGYADKIEIHLVNQGTKSITIDISQGVSIGGSGSDRIGFDFSRGGSSSPSSTWIDNNYGTVTSVDPSRTDYPTLEPGKDVTITVYFSTSDDNELYWRDGYWINIKVYLTGAAAVIQKVQVDIPE